MKEGYNPHYGARPLRRLPRGHPGARHA
ncbi:MAG: hypothetical protein ACLFWB_06810 [Armatimonadota bacterium]